MFKIVTTAAVAALLTTSAMAKAPVAKLTAGQFVGVTQYTGLVDPSGLCGSAAGLAVGQLTYSVATVGALGTAWTSTIANPNNAPGTYGVGWINCQFPALPLASAFVATPIGAETEFVATPAGAQNATCTASVGGTVYVLGSGNGTLSNGLVQTNTITILPVNGTGKDSSFRQTTTNSSVTIGTNTLCYLSTDGVYSNASK
jgi:hypothetical protein